MDIQLDTELKTGDFRKTNAMELVWFSNVQHSLFTPVTNTVTAPNPTESRTEDVIKDLSNNAVRVLKVKSV